MDTTKLERDSQIRTTALVVLTFIAVAVALYFLRPVLLPFVLALFIASGVAPVLVAVERWLKSSRAVAIFFTAVVSISVTALLWLAIWISVKQLVSTDGPYQAGFHQMGLRIAQGLSWLDLSDSAANKPPKETESDSGPPIAAGESDRLVADPIATDLESELENNDLSIATELGDVPLSSETPPADFAQLTQFFEERAGAIIQVTTNELFSVFSSGMLVMIFLFFLLLGGSDVKLPEDNIWREVDGHVRKYIVAKSLISAVTGGIFGLVLWMFGVPLAFVLGILAFFLNFIPNLGPIIASLLPVPLIWVLVETTWANDAAGSAIAGASGIHFGLAKGILVIALAAGVQFISGNVIEPKIMGEQFRLHPIAILLSLMFWYMIWGMVGAFLAVPITSALKIIFSELESTRPAADLLEGNLNILARRPASSQVAASGPA